MDSSIGRAGAMKPPSAASASRWPPTCDSAPVPGTVPAGPTGRGWRDLGRASASAPTTESGGELRKPGCSCWRCWLCPRPSACSIDASRQRRHAIRFTGVSTLAGVVPNANRVRRHVPLALVLAALAVLALALAKPERSVGVPVERASVTLVTDVSRSMKADDVAPSRLEAARKAGERFLDQAPPQLRIGSVTFSDTPQIVERPSEDRNEARSVLDGLVADGGTATGEGLQAALDSLDRERGKDGKREPAAILLLSDGESTIGRDPVGVAREAGQRGVPVFTVALGTESAVVEGPNGELLPVPPDPETLRRMSEVWGGQAFSYLPSPTSWTRSTKNSARRSARSRRSAR